MQTRSSDGGSCQPRVRARAFLEGESFCPAAALAAATAAAAIDVVAGTAGVDLLAMRFSSSNEFGVAGVSTVFFTLLGVVVGVPLDIVLDRCRPMGANVVLLLLLLLMKSQLLAQFKVEENCQREKQ